MTARSGKARRSATIVGTPAYGSACSNWARAMRKSGVSHSRGCSRACASTRDTCTSSLGRGLAEGARKAVAQARDRGCRERLAEHAADELARLAHDRLALRREARPFEQERAACTRRPLERAVQPVRRRPVDANVRSEIDGAPLEPSGVRAVCLAAPFELLSRGPRLGDPALGRLQVVTRVLQRALGLETLGLAALRLERRLLLPDRGLRPRPRRERRPFLVRPGGEQLRVRVERAHRRRGSCTQLLDVPLQPFDAVERLRDLRVAALQLCGEREQRFHRRPRTAYAPLSCLPALERSAPRDAPWSRGGVARSVRDRNRAARARLR